MPSYISVPALVAPGACHSNQILEGVVPVTNGPEFAAFISSKHNWGGYMNAITIICTCIGEEDKQQAKSCRDRHIDTGCWHLNDSTEEPCMEVTADLPWSRHKRMDSWMVSECHWFWNKWLIHIKRHGKPRRCRACFVQVISPNKNNKKETYKTPHAAANGDECHHPAWEAKPLNLMTPLHLRQKKLRWKVTESQWVVSSEEAKAMNAECHAVVCHIALARGTYTPFDAEPKLSSPSAEETAAVCSSSVETFSRCCQRNQPRLQSLQCYTWHHSTQKTSSLCVYPLLPFCESFTTIGHWYPPRLQRGIHRGRSLCLRPGGEDWPQLPPLPSCMSLPKSHWEQLMLNSKHRPAKWYLLRELTFPISLHYKYCRWI